MVTNLIRSDGKEMREVKNALIAYALIIHNSGCYILYEYVNS